MSVSQQTPVPNERQPAQSSDHLEELRDILLRGDKQYLTDAVKSVLAEATARRVQESGDKMASALAPIMGQAIRQQIRNAQTDIVDALYPIIGQLIQRSVAEAMRALARRVDEGLRSTFSVGRLARRIRARLRGVSEADLVLREALPFQAQEVFLIHRASGLLLEHISRSSADEADADLTSSMLTAIRDFAEDTFGTEREGELDAIQYGEASILIEPGPSAYLAVVAEGIEPEGYRHQMRSVLSDVHRHYSPVLENYDGDATALSGAEGLLRPLLPALQSVPTEGQAQRTPWLAVALAGVVLAFCLSVGCFGAWRLTWGRPVPMATATAPSAATPTHTAIVAPTTVPSDTAAATPLPIPTSTQTPAPTSTQPPTLTATATPAPSATVTPSPAPYVAVMIGNVWLRGEPRDASPLTGARVDEGRPVEVVAIYDTWYLVRWPPGDPTGTSGWVPARWVGVVAAPPLQIITPVP